MWDSAQVHGHVRGPRSSSGGATGRLGEDNVKFKVELNYFFNMKGRKKPLFSVQSIRTDLAGSAQRADDVHTPELTWEGEIPS